MRKIITLIKLLITLRIFHFFKLKIDEYNYNKIKEKKIPFILDFIKKHKFKGTDQNILKKQGQILIECMWDNPVHWLRMAMIKPAIEKNMVQKLVY